MTAFQSKNPSNVIDATIQSIDLKDLQNNSQRFNSQKDLQALIQRELWEVFNAGSERSTLHPNGVLSQLNEQVRQRLLSACELRPTGTGQFSFSQDAVTHWDAYYEGHFRIHSEWTPGTTASTESSQLHF